MYKSYFAFFERKKLFCLKLKKEVCSILLDIIWNIENNEFHLAYRDLQQKQKRIH